MSQENSKPVSFVDTTVCLQWELTKEDFDNCEFPNKIDSPKFAVQIGNDKSEWVIGIYPKGDCDLSDYEVPIFLKLLSESKTYEVRYSIGVKTADGYWPDDFVGVLEENDFHTINSGEDYWQRHPSSPQHKFSEQFIDNKMTLVAHLVFSLEEGKSPIPMQIDEIMIANDFIDDFKEISSLDSLSDFTVICHGKSFPCHKLLLALRSKYFEALFRNETKNEIIIDFAFPEIVEAVLDFMSKGIIPSDINAKAMDLIPLADMYGLNLLAKACEVSLMKNLSPENVLETFVIVDKHVQTVETRQKILAFIKKESLQIVKTQNWTKFVQEYPGLVTEIISAMSSK